jgi:signal transduction histidine kinase/ActR/RegA family two-component response regulator
MREYKLQDVLDIGLFQTLQDKLNEIYSFPSAIIDNEGNILTATAWQDICTKFHRVHPVSNQECIKSDQYIMAHLGEANPAVTYRCPHGLVDNATPIIVGGKHLGNFFTGQFFLEPPDMDFFKTQAERFGFEMEEYLSAVSRVPVWSREKLDKYLDFIKGFVEILAGIGYKNLKEIETREELSRRESQRKHLEQELQRSQKLESLGVFAGGIAHDFNNLLSIIYGNLQFIEGSGEDKELIAICLKTLNRAKAITSQLLTFAKGGVPVKKTGSLDGFLQESVKFALSGSDCVAEFDLEPGLWSLDYDEGQIGQVFDNIVINATQAMPNGGRIGISARNITVPSVREDGSASGEYVRISVRDSGIGMTPEVLERVFEPYYTTKKTGRGLGLASAYSIVKRHDGWIDVESEPGKGSVFHIFLPASRRRDERNVSGAHPVQKGSGKILVMDDEEPLRQVYIRMLQSFGFSAIGAGNGEEVLAILKSPEHREEPFTAAILDLTIPGGMGGKRTVEEIRKFASDLPVFVASGYSDDPIMARPEDYGFDGSLKKPFEPKDLFDMLKNGRKR